MKKVHKVSNPKRNIPTFLELITDHVSSVLKQRNPQTPGQEANYITFRCTFYICTEQAHIPMTLLHLYFRDARFEYRPGHRYPNCGFRRFSLFLQQSAKTASRWDLHRFLLNPLQFTFFQSSCIHLAYYHYAQSVAVTHIYKCAPTYI
jgi:hypothetical protein